jgi:uncharacterized protein (DUF885 family)
MDRNIKAFFIVLIGAAAIWYIQPKSGDAPMLEPTKTAEAVETEDDRANAFFEEIFERGVAESPQRQARLGRKSHMQDQWDDRSDAKEVENMGRALGDLARLQSTIKYEDLSDQVKLSYDLFVFNTTTQVDNFGFRYHGYVLDQFRGQVSRYLTTLQNIHPIRDVKGAEDYIARITGLEGVWDSFVTKLQDRAARGVVTPSFAYGDVISDLESISSGAPITEGNENALFVDFKKKLTALALDGSEEQALIARVTSALQGPYASGLSRLITEVKHQQGLSKGNFGVWSLPNGKAFYENRVKNYTTLDFSADEIHQIGIEDVARIHEKMKTIMVEVGFEGNLQDFFKFIKEDPNNYYEDSDAGRQVFLDEAKKQIDDIFAVAGQYFNRLPKADMEVRRVEPWRENSTSIAFYNSPSQDGSRPGIYYANMKDMKNFQKYVFKAISYHESVPGHHFQIALAQELEGVPMFRKFGGYGAYTEGWALYAEQLAHEMGFYKNPYYYFGQLQDEIWRSARLVIDTGIHAKRWTREQAIEYFRDNTPLSEGDIVTEVERFFVNPGQALSYKMGMIKILTLREKAKAALGDKFDIRFFHDAILSQGSLPLPVLEVQVNRYIEASK